jgi:hypothetical protein
MSLSSTWSKRCTAACPALEAAVADAAKIEAELATGIGARRTYKGAISAGRSAPIPAVRFGKSSVRAGRVG